MVHRRTANKGYMGLRGEPAYMRYVAEESRTGCSARIYWVCDDPLFVESKLVCRAIKVLMMYEYLTSCAQQCHTAPIPWRTKSSIRISKASPRSRCCGTGSEQARAASARRLRRTPLLSAAISVLLGWRRPYQHTAAKPGYGAIGVLSVASLSLVAEGGSN